MSSYRVGVPIYLFDSTGAPKGMLGLDGRAWAFPQALTSGSTLGLRYTQIPALFDLTTGQPRGFIGSDGREYLFPADLTLSSTAGWTIGTAPELEATNALPSGVNTWQWPVALVLDGSTQTPWRFATFGDSRSDLEGGSGGGSDPYDGVTRNFKGSSTNQSTFMSTIQLFRNDVVLTANGGASGEQTSNWNGSRLSGRNYSSVVALQSDGFLIEYGINNVKSNVTSTATRDSVATAAIADMQALITALLTTGKKIIWITTMQCDTTGYSGTFTVEKRDCCDYINYGNGGAIVGMKPWIQSLPQYNSQIFVYDCQALLNIGGVSTGAYIDNTWAPDGIHLGDAGTRRVANDFKSFLDTVFPYRGVQALYRSTGPNLIPAVNATYYGGETLSACAKSAITYGTDGSGRPYGEVTITPNNVAAGSYKFELLPDVGTNGGRTPLGGTFVAGDKLQSRVLLTIDNGAGGAAVVNNVLMFTFVSYIGGTPSLQQIQYGYSGQGPSNRVVPDIDAQYMTQPMVMTGDSSLIGAPSGGNGYRIYIQIYFGVTPTPFRVRWTAPEVRKIV